MPPRSEHNGKKRTASDLDAQEGAQTAPGLNANKRPRRAPATRKPDPNAEKAPNGNASWVQADISTLIHERNDDVGHKIVAKKLGRTNQSCRLKIHHIQNDADVMEVDVFTYFRDFMFNDDPNVRLLIRQRRRQADKKSRTPRRPQSVATQVPAPSSGSLSRRRLSSSTIDARNNANSSPVSPRDLGDPSGTRMSSFRAQLGPQPQQHNPGQDEDPTCDSDSPPACLLPARSRRQRRPTAAASGDRHTIIDYPDWGAHELDLRSSRGSPVVQASRLAHRADHTVPPQFRPYNSDGTYTYGGHAPEMGSIQVPRRATCFPRIASADEIMYAQRTTETSWPRIVTTGAAALPTMEAALESPEGAPGARIRSTAPSLFRRDRPSIDQESIRTDSMAQPLRTSPGGYDERQVGRLGLQQLCLAAELEQEQKQCEQQEQERRRLEEKDDGVAK